MTSTVMSGSQEGALSKALSKVAIDSPLMRKIKDMSAHVGVLGMGYVGLPLACCFANAGYPVTGFDVVEGKIKARQRGDPAGSDLTHEYLKKTIDEKSIEFTTDFSKVRDMQAIIICVPTPLTESMSPDLTFIKAAMGEALKHIQPNTIVTLESTTYPGCTREIIAQAIEEATSLRVGHDAFVCFSPERVDPGNQDFNTQSTPKVIGGMTEECLAHGIALYENVIAKVVPVETPEEAEMVKLLENIFRSVNIGLVNELAQLAHRMGVNMFNVIKAAASKPFGYMPFYPGPGIGGHCIPLDPQYLQFTAKKYKHFNRFIELACDVNENMPEFVIQRLMLALNDIGKCAKNAKILLVGVAYKKNVDDPRESPSIPLWKKMEKLGCQVSYCDPYIPTFCLDHHNPDAVQHKGVEATAEEFRKYDMVLVSTDHDCFDWKELVQHSNHILDTRNAIANRGLLTEENKSKVTVL